MSGEISVQDAVERSVAQLMWTDELIRTFWESVGCTHLDDLSFGKLAGPKFLRLIREHIPADAEICDFGAGGGHFAETLLKNGFATGVYEPSPRRGETLREKLSVYDRFLGVIGPADGRRFNVVIMAEVIEHVPDRLLGHTLDRVKRLLRGDGIVIVTTPNNENIAQAQVLCPVCRQIFHPWQHLRSFTHQSLEKLLCDHGFRRRFVGLVDFSDDASAIDRGQLLSLLIEFMRRLAGELTEFERHLAPDEMGKETSWAAGSVYATDNLQFDHLRALAEIAKLRSLTEAQIREISGRSEEKIPQAVLMQICDEAYSRLRLLIGAQQKQAQIQQRLMDAQQKQAQIQQLKNAVADVVARFRSVNQAIESMGIAASLEQQGISFLRSPGSKIYWATRLCWEFLRHPAVLAEVVMVPSVLADYASATSMIGQNVAEAVLEADPRRETGEATAIAKDQSGATEAVLVHLRSIAQRIEHALSTFARSSADQQTELGYDLYLGRGSNILYVGEKV